VDSSFSLEPAELKCLVLESERAWQSLGQITYGPTPAEEKARFRRRSLYIAKDMQAGETLTPENLRRIRPGHGLAPKYYELLLGRKVAQSVPKGTPLSWDMLG
jgi:N-acetylneuraminate synthase